jgi:MoxR-like ATPase
MSENPRSPLSTRSHSADEHVLTDDALAEISGRFRAAAAALEESFLGKEEVIRLFFISAIAGEHLLMIGPPGTAKSALARGFAELIDARYFDYLLTRFTEPNEIFGPVDIQAFREGTYRRRTEGMLPVAQIAFLDEIFKSNSAILNSLLTLLSARRFNHGGYSESVPLISMIAASNDVPTDESLSAIFDRFLLRVGVDYLDSYHFRGLLQKGAALEARALAGDGAGAAQARISANDLDALSGLFSQMLTNLDEEFLATYKALVFQIRGEGIGLSDRRVVKMLKLFAASAIFDGRKEVNDSDLFVLRHIWNTPEQQDLLQEIVGPILDQWYEQNPEERRVGATPASLQDLLSELRLIRETLGNSEVLSDMQLFSQLRNLGDIKAALMRMHGNPAAERMVGEVDSLLETLFASSRFV